jgi:hypothetical protein
MFEHTHLVEVAVKTAPKRQTVGCPEKAPKNRIFGRQPLVILAAKGPHTVSNYKKIRFLPGLSVASTVKQRATV